MIFTPFDKLRAGSTGFLGIRIKFFYKYSARWGSLTKQDFANKSPRRGGMFIAISNTQNQNPARGEIS